MSIAAEAPQRTIAATAAQRMIAGLVSFGARGARRLVSSARLPQSNKQTASTNVNKRTQIGRQAAVYLLTQSAALSVTLACLRCRLSDCLSVCLTVCLSVGRLAAAET